MTFFSFLEEHSDQEVILKKPFILATARRHLMTVGQSLFLLGPSWYI